MKKVNAELDAMSQNTEAIGKLKSAFSEIRQAAMEFFREQHQNIMSAIDDELRHKNAILDKKAALNQAPVDAAQRALDARRKQIEEWRLREGVRTATDPAAQRDAILALQDFLAQQKIDQMRAEAEMANDRIKTRQEANQNAANLAKEAEQKRYEQMQRDFEYQLQLLQDYLSKHPGEWQKVEDKILNLLNSYGFSYGEAGRLLGSSFTSNLRTQLSAAVEAARNAATQIGQVLSPVTGQAYPVPDTDRNGQYNTPVPRPGGGAVPMAHGSWDILGNNLLAALHAKEMVLPASVAPLARAFGEKDFDFKPQGIPIPVERTANGRAQPIQIYIGDEKVGDVIDYGMARQHDTYGDSGYQGGTGSSAR
jgi:hypothetical protein